MIDAETLYNIHRDQHFRVTGERLPYWVALDWRKQDGWQAVADEVNLKDREVQP